MISIDALWKIPKGILVFSSSSIFLLNLMWSIKQVDKKTNDMFYKNIFEASLSLSFSFSFSLSFSLKVVCAKVRWCRFGSYKKIPRKICILNPKNYWVIYPWSLHFFQKCRLLINIFLYFCMFVKKNLLYLWRVSLKK